MEHLFINCHGEWMVAFQVLATLPFIGVWFRAHRHHHGEQK